MSKSLSNCWWLPVLCLAAAASSGAAAAGGAVGEQSQGVLFTQPLLSETEQADYRARIRSAKDEAERERIRTAHYELMKARAKERGYALPETRPAATGIQGDAFSPQLISEEERAAQRARIRARNEPSGAAGAPARRESAVEIAKPVQQEQAVDSSSRAGESKGVTVARTPPVSPAQTAATPSSAAIVLPGIDTIFGPQLMTEEEKAAYRARLRRAKSDEERRAIRDERDQQILQRAKEKGVTLPR